MKSLKHIGRFKSNNLKVLVVFRTLPGQSDQALVLPVNSLSPDQHDSIMTLVETPQAQDSFEFGEIMFIRTFPDGRPILSACQSDNLMLKVPTTNIVMTPNTSDEIMLSDLNVLIAEQKNCAVDDLYTFVSGAKKKSDASVTDIAKIQDLGRDVGEPNIPRSQNISAAQPLSDTDLAIQYRNQATSMLAEAERLRLEADKLDPPTTKPTRRASPARKSKANAHAVT